MSETSPNPKKLLVRRWAFIALSMAILGAVAVLLIAAEDTVDVTRKDSAPAAQIVSVLARDSAPTAARISVFAELRPRWRAEIRAAVSGRILAVHKAALAGARVAEGTPLFEIERSQYETGLAMAEMSLEEAELVELRAKNKVTVARKQFQRDGVVPPSDLALHLPNLRVAQRAVVSARAQLAAARQQLADTGVTAPFSGFITDRRASLGQTVTVGEPLVTLSDDSHFELTAELSQADWALLKHPIAGGTARIFDRSGRPLGVANIRHGGGFLDTQTRQIRVFLELSNPAEGVLAGDFFRITFDGREIADALTLPESAMTRAGHIWLVDTNDRLVRHTPDILFRADGLMTIAPPQDLSLPSPWRVAITPLASFLPGQLVSPSLSEE